MRTKLFLVPVLFGMYFCTPPKYTVKIQSELAAFDLDNSIVNFIPLADSDVSRSIILDSTYSLIEAKKYSKLELYINSVETTGVHSPDFYLSKTLLFITQNDYLKASGSLKQLRDSDYLMLKRLLSIDLNYELSKKAVIVNYNDFLKWYQDLIDSYPDDSSLKKIVGIRIRYIRYNY